VDFIRHETARADLQNALDRGVLAAADLEQTWVTANGDDQVELESQYTELVKSYMETRAFGQNPVVEVTPTIGLASKKIAATASYDMNTYFLRLMGITSIKVPAASTAIEGRQKIEISLVLDVSGSMYNTKNNIDYVNNEGNTVNGRRIDLLKQEAVKFVTNLLANDPTGTDRTISIVPYSHQVSMSPNMAQAYTGFYANREHDYSYCMDFEEVDYPVTAIEPSFAWPQYQHFWYSGNTSNKTNSCSKTENNMLLYSNNETALHDHIKGMKKEYWTSVYLGMRWGAALLDPSTQSVVNSLVTAGEVPAEFAGLPRNYGEADTIKIVILMSDGENTIMPKMTADGYASGADDVTGADYWKDNKPSAANIQNHTTEAEVPDGYNLYGYNGNKDNNTVGTYTTYENGSPIKKGDARLYEACNAAKAEKNGVPGTGMVVYTIGFLAGNNANRALERCASPGKFNDATGENLAQVFDSIVNDIDKLQLTN